MKIGAITSTVLLSGLALAGCADMFRMDPTPSGFGPLPGDSAGQELGRRMPEADRLKVAQVLETARQLRPVTWRNPDEGSQYTLTHIRTYTIAKAPCREYTLDAFIKGYSDQLTGIACREADGSWQGRNWVIPLPVRPI